MFQTMKNAWKVPDLRKKLLYTLFMLVIFRLGTVIPVPGLNAAAMKSMVEGDNASSLFGILDTFSGGAFSQATIFAMSITPYINASIIMQLLTVAIPALERMSKEGMEGRKKINEITRYLAVGLAFLQATGLYFGLRNVVETRSLASYVIITLSFTAGTAFLMWLGEEISQKGIGNGISILIFAGIVARIPTMAQIAWTNYKDKWYVLVLILLYTVASIAFVIYVTRAERRIPVQYAKRVVGRKMYGGQSSNIPLKIAAGGVIPIIFAMSIMSFPGTLAQFFGAGNGTGFWSKFVALFSPTSWFYAVLYFLLIIGFTFFYTSITFNPMEISNNLKTNGGFVPGIRPGRPTSDFVSKILGRITLVGAIFLAIIAIIPILVSVKVSSFRQLSLGGTSLLIVVGVVLETVEQIEAQMLMRHYTGFLE